MSVAERYGGAKRVLDWWRRSRAYPEAETLGREERMKRAKRFVLVVICGGVLTGLTGVETSCAPPPMPMRVQPVKANDFLNTMGVGIHHIQGIDSIEAIEAGLLYTGIRNVRDDGTHNPRLIADLCAIHSATGAMVDELPVVDADPNNIALTKAEYDGLASCGAMLAAEGPNEPNNFNFQYNGATCSVRGSFVPCAAFMSAEYAMVHSDLALAGKQLWDMTEPGAEPDNVHLQFLQGFADVANLHNYVRGNHQRSVARNQAWLAESTTSGPWDNLAGEYCRSTWRKGFAATPFGSACDAIPKVTTETGWPTDGSITPDQQGKLLTNVYLSAAKLNWRNTFVFMLFDESQGPWGFFASSDGTSNVKPKPLGIYTHNLTSILADTSSAFTPAIASYSIVNSSITVHDLLIQKSSGLHELAIWDDRPVGDGADDVIVRLGESFATVKVYDITLGSGPVQTLNKVNSVQLILTDHAMIIEF